MGEKCPIFEKLPTVWTCGVSLWLLRAKRRCGYVENDFNKSKGGSLSSLWLCVLVSVSLTLKDWHHQVAQFYFLTRSASALMKL